MYVALVRVGEVSGTLDQVLEMLGAERARAELMRRKLTDAMQYPAFVLIAAACVMLFFILFVLPQFSSVLQDFGAKSDSALSVFIKLSDFLRANAAVMMLAAAAVLAGAWWLLRRPGAGAAIMTAVSRVPGIGGIFQFYRTSLFCRNLGVLLGSGVNLTATLRILVDIMAVTGNVTTAGRRPPIASVMAANCPMRLLASSSMPPMAIRMLRLGEETGQLPVLAGRVAEFYEAKLQRSLDRIVGIVGPLAIVTISTVVGGLIVSVMTALLSVTQLVG